jgi:DNA-binding IclR family transcriptional regulator
MQKLWSMKRRQGGESIIGTFTSPTSAAPVFLSDGETLIGAMAIAGIRDRLLEKYSKTEIANVLVEATSDLSRLINNINILPD